jgi:hypothetical protein
MRYVTDIMYVKNDKVVKFNNKTAAKSDKNYKTGLSKISPISLYL